MRTDRSAAPPSLWPYLAVAVAVFASYGIAGATSQSLFLQYYSAAKLPEVWLWVGGISIVAALMLGLSYGRFCLTQIYVYSALISAAGFAALFVALDAGYSWAAYALYIFKDVYIVVLSELFWTHSNGRFAAGRAARIYGIFCAVGSLGTACGSLLVAPMAATIGTVKTFWLVVPCCVWASFAARNLGARTQPAQRGVSRDGHAQAPKAASQLRSAASVLRHSHMVGLLVALVATVQLAITVMDFQFSDALAQVYVNMDERTSVLGYTTVAINLLSLLLQFSTGPLFGYFGLGPMLVAIPTLLGVACSAYVVVPSFVTVCAIKVWGKSTDYSLLRAGKEMLYIPLSAAERTHGKVLVDVLTYRCAKPLASLLLWGLAREGLGAHLSLVSIGLCAIWGAVTLAILRERRGTLTSKR